MIIIELVKDNVLKLWSMIPWVRNYREAWELIEKLKFNATAGEHVMVSNDTIILKDDDSTESRYYRVDMEFGELTRNRFLMQEFHEFFQKLINEYSLTGLGWTLQSFTSSEDDKIDIELEK